MVLTFLGRESEDLSIKEYCCYIWELLAMVLNELVFEVSSLMNVFFYFLFYMTVFDN